MLQVTSDNVEQKILEENTLIEGDAKEIGWEINIKKERNLVKSKH